MFTFSTRLRRKNRQLQALDGKTQQLVSEFLDTPLPRKQHFINDAELIAVDFETTGLVPAKDDIISMGFCPVHNGIIRLADCLHIVINTEQALTSDNVAIHGLTDDVLTRGITQQQALLKFMELTKGKVIIAHFHSIERTFIQKLAKQMLGMSLPLSFIDTFWLAEKRMKNRQQAIASNSLRLFNLRKQRGLPNYKAHNALEDAISTAELFMAQQASIDNSMDKTRLRDVGLFNYKK